MVVKANFVKALIPEEHIDSESGFVWTNGSQMILKSISDPVGYIHEIIRIQTIPKRNSLRGGLPWS